MADLRGALVGCGFFAHNHAHAWHEVDGARIAAVCDANAERARQFAREFGIERSFSDVDAMLEATPLDYVDIVTPPTTHRAVLDLAAERGLHVICQKPMAPSLEDARAMVQACASHGVQFMVHENFRWQSPMREVLAASRNLGKPSFGRLSFCTGFDVFANQPYLAREPRLIVYDLGVHLLDLARFFMGDVEQLYCQTQKVNPAIAGEDAATIVLQMGTGATCVVEMRWGIPQAEELFPQTLVVLEGAHGSVTLGPNYAMTVVRDRAIERRTIQPQSFAWSTPPWQVVQESVVRTQQHWVDCLRERREPDTSGADNLNTLELVFAAYESADTSSVVRIT